MRLQRDAARRRAPEACRSAREDDIMKQVATFLTLGLLSTLLVGAGEVDHQNLDDKTDFHWQADESTILYSLSQMPHEYKFRLDYDPAESGMNLTFLKAENVVITFRGHEHSVFKIHDDILYYPAFHFSSSGCQIVAYDLKSKKELWRKKVKGIGSVLHSAYQNLITLDVNDNVVTIHGHESNGDYIESLDRNSGDIVSHQEYNIIFNKRREK